MPDFIPGLELSRWFYQEAVQPILAAQFPATAYSAALIGSGSEVLGFDTAMSTDHHWGPRLLLFLREADFAVQREAIHTVLSQQLPHTFHGYPTNFSPPDPDDNSVQLLQASDSGPINHRVEIFMLRGFFQDYLNVDITAPLEPADWLTLPEQKLLTITAGAVYHDGIGLQAVRDRFAYYPDDVWLYLLAAMWTRIGQEEHLMPRAAYVGDELGAALIASRLVRDVMRLGFLMERRYAPYAKWFGTAFAQLDCAAELTPLLRRVQLAETWPEREPHLAAAYETLARMHNALGITEALPTAATSFFGRPFQVIHGETFASALCDRISDPAVKRIAQRGLIGSIDQISDNTDLLSDSSWRLKLRVLYE